MSIKDDYCLNNVMRKYQMVEFGELVFKIYKEQFKDIKNAYELCEEFAYQPPENKTDVLCKAHDAFYNFFNALYEAANKKQAEQEERAEKMRKEHEEILERINDPVW